MNSEVRDFVVEKTHALMDAFSCSREAKEAAQAWLAALGTQNEAEETQKYIAELEEDIVTVDGLIAFASSEAGAQVFGADKAKEVAAHARDIKAAGAKYCDCPACAAVEAILARKEDILK
nr:molecular chaperone Hsp90 [Maliibacterium massiliense]